MCKQLNVFAFVFLTICGSIGSAANSFRIGSAAGAFSDAAGWYGGVPGPLDSAWFTNNVYQTISWTADTTTASAFFDGASAVLTQSAAGFRWSVTESYILGLKPGSSHMVTHVSGTLAVTNSEHTAKMVLGAEGVGEFRLDGGTLLVDSLLFTNRSRHVLGFGEGRLVTLADSLLSIPNGPEGLNPELQLGTTEGGDFQWNLLGGFFDVAFPEYEGTTLTTLGFASGSRVAMTVDGPSTVFRTHDLLVGGIASQGRLVITNGGKLLSPFATIGGVIDSDNPRGSNSVIVTGGGSKWLLREESGGRVSSLQFGASSNTAVVVTDGGTIAVDYLEMAGFGGKLSVEGAGSTLDSAAGVHWDLGCVLAGFDNEIVISNGGALLESHSLQVTMISGGNNSVIVRSGGRLVVTNEVVYDNFQQGLKIGSSEGSGKLIVDGGSVEATLLDALDPQNSIIDFRSGTITSSALSLNPDAVYVVGDGIGEATLNLKDSDVRMSHSFGSLVISSNATLNFSGTNLLAAGVLVVTNGPTSRVNFEGGTYYANRIMVSNGLPFRIGDGSHKAELVLFQNDGTFADGLVVSSNSALYSIAIGAEVVPIHGNIRFDQGSSWRFLLGYTGCPETNAVPHVAGNVVLRTIIDVAGASRFVPASQPLFTYAGTLDTNGVSFANVPSGYSYSIDTSVPGEARLRVDFIGPLPGGSLANVVKCGFQVSISFPTISGERYVLERCDDLAGSNWTPFATNVGTGKIVYAIDSNAGVSERFYRFKR